MHECGLLVLHWIRTGGRRLHHIHAGVTAHDEARSHDLSKAKGDHFKVAPRGSRATPQRGVDLQFSLQFVTLDSQLNTKPLVKRLVGHTHAALLT